MMQIGSLCLLLMSAIYSKEADFITYEWLIDVAQKTAYTDHIPHFRRLFNTTKVRGLLECGCGYSTKYFMDQCKEVTSIEFMTKGTSDLWFKECFKLYADCDNWIPIAYNADLKNDSFDKACGYQCSTHQDYALIDPRYFQELDHYFKQLLDAAARRGKNVDVAFVDAGVYIRGDMVKILLQHHVPVVIAHDTASDVGSDVNQGLYGWFKVKTPLDYEKIFIPVGVGTTFWIHKGCPEIIASISEYRDQILKLDNAMDYAALTRIADLNPIE